MESNIIAPTFEDTGGVHPQWTGRRYVALAGVTNMFDELVTTERMLRGGWYEIMEATAADGDYLESAVVDKDDVLGLFSAYGMTVGTHVLELKKYIRKDYINPLSLGRREEFIAKSVFTVLAGLYIRTIYKSVGVQNVTFKTQTITYE